MSLSRQPITYAFDMAGYFPSFPRPPGSSSLSLRGGGRLQGSGHRQGRPRRGLRPTAYFHGKSKACKIGRSPPNILFRVSLQVLLAVCPLSRIFPRLSCLREAQLSSPAGFTKRGSSNHSGDTGSRSLLLTATSGPFAPFLPPPHSLALNLISSGGITTAPQCLHRLSATYTIFPGPHKTSAPRTAFADRLCPLHFPGISNSTPPWRPGP